MKIRLVSHASVIISCSDAKIRTDPWLVSKERFKPWTCWMIIVFKAGMSLKGNN